MTVLCIIDAMTQNMMADFLAEIGYPPSPTTTKGAQNIG